MISTIQRMVDVAQIHRSHPHLFGSLPCSRPIEEEPFAPLLFGIGELGSTFRDTPGDHEQLALLGADLYLLLAMLMAGRTSSPPSERDVAALAMKQVERYQESRNGERWRSQPPLEHLMHAFKHWTAVAGPPGAESRGLPGGTLRMQLADLANYLTFFLTVCGALDRLPDVAAAS